MPRMTTFIPKDTCIVRAVSRNDSRVTLRWFAFYGSPHDVAKYCQSKRFVEKYSVEGKYQYFKVLKDMPLLTLPYMSAELFNTEQVIQALNVAKLCLEYLLYHGEQSATIRTYGLGNTINDVNDVLLNMIDESDIPTGKAFKHVLRLFRYHKKIMTQPISLTDERRRLNPDYSFAKLICEMGYMGWVRQASSQYWPGDELMVCNLNIKYLKECAECQLDPDC